MTENAQSDSVMKRHAVLAWMLVLIFVGAAVWLLARFGQQPSPARQTSTEVSQAATPAALPPERAVVQSRMGTVAAVDDDAVTFTTVVYNEANRAYERQQLTALVAASTAFVQEDRRTLTPAAPGTETGAPTTTIEHLDIRAGDTVLISAGVNIRGERRFTATEIRKILLP